MTEHKNDETSLLGNDEVPKNVMGWTLRRTSKGYYEAVRRVNGRLKSVYLGRDWTKVYSVLPAEGEPVSGKPDAKGETPTDQADQTKHEEHGQAAAPGIEAVSTAGLPCRTGQFCRFHEQECCWFNMYRRCAKPVVKTPESPKRREGAFMWGGCKHRG